jgi:hypothetical protein
MDCGGASHRYRYPHTRRTLRKQRLYPIFAWFSILTPGDLSRVKENIMKGRVILVCTLLLLAAVPSFALPLCQDCNEFNQCETVSGAFERCRYDAEGNCYLNPFERCSIPSAATTVLTDWKVVTVEISRPGLDSITVTAPGAAEAPTPQTTELK